MKNHPYTHIPVPFEEVDEEMARRDEDKENELPETDDESDDDEDESDEFVHDDEQEIMEIYEDSSRRMQFVSEPLGRKDSFSATFTSTQSTPALIQSSLISAQMASPSPAIIQSPIVTQSPMVAQSPLVTQSPIVSKAPTPRGSLSVSEIPIQPSAPQVVTFTPRSSITGSNSVPFIPSVSNWKSPRSDIKLPPTPPFKMDEFDDDFVKVSVKELINTFENVQHREKVHVKTIDRIIKESSSESEASSEGKRTFPELSIVFVSFTPLVFS